MAERELVLSCPASDERGNPTVLSPFVDEVAACLEEGLPRSELPPTAIVPSVEDCCEPAELLARSAQDRWARGPGAPDRLGPALRDALPEGAGRIAAIDRRAAIEERRSRYFLSPRTDGEETARAADAWVGRLGGDRALLGARLAAMKWSPTRLERLGTCGFRFFATYLLGLGEQRDPVLEVGPDERGTLFHRVLEEFFRTHPRLPADPAAARALARTFLESARTTGAAAIAAKDPSFLAPAWSALAASLDELIALELEAEARRRAEGTVVERDLELTHELVLEDRTGGAPLTLAGTPDRVERERRGAAITTLRVLDYKVTRDFRRFRALLDPERALGRTAFQIPVYLLGALRAAGAAVDATTVLEGGFIAVLAPPRQKLQVRALSPELVMGLVPDRIRALVAAAGEGRFDVDPDPCDPWCPYRAVCRYQPPPLEDDDADA
jgi:RecB family exonuclease